MRAEQQAMLERLPALAGRRVLDLACGSGRYSRLLLEAHAGRVVALDFCIPMLRRSTRRAASAPAYAAAFPGQIRLICVVSGLALGHADRYRPMDERSCACCGRGTVLYSDFHPEAARAGMTRSFKDDGNETWTVPHQAYDLECQQHAAAAAGLSIQALAEIRVGIQLTEPFGRLGRNLSRLARTAIVLVVEARK